MKRITMLMAAIIAVTTMCFAQKGETSIAGQFFMTPCLEDHGPFNVGLGANIRYNFSNPVRGELALDYGFKDKHIGVFTMSANVHYLIPCSRDFRIYPTTGIGFGHLSGWGDSTNKFLFNIGLGGEYKVAHNVALIMEMKYQYMEDFNRFPISLGVQFTL